MFGRAASAPHAHSVAASDAVSRDRLAPEARELTRRSMILRLVVQRNFIVVPAVVSAVDGDFVSGVVQHLLIRLEHRALAATQWIEVVVQQDFQSPRTQRGQRNA